MDRYLAQIPPLVRQNSPSSISKYRCIPLLEYVPMSTILQSVSNNIKNAEDTIRGLRISMLALQTKYKELSSRYVDPRRFGYDIFRDSFWNPSLWCSEIKFAVIDRTNMTRGMVCFIHLNQILFSHDSTSTLCYRSKILLMKITDG